MSLSVSRFFYGNMENMELPTLKWWNSKRKEYNVRFLSCLLITQLLFFLLSFSLGGIDGSNAAQRIILALFGDVVILIILNIIYFLWPALEAGIFKNMKIAYRKNCFALLNGFNLLILISAIVVVFPAKT